MDLLLVQPTHSLVQVLMAVYIVNVLDQGCLRSNVHDHNVFALMNILVLPTQTLQKSHVFLSDADTALCVLCKLLRFCDGYIL